MGVDGDLLEINEDDPTFGAELRLFRKVCDKVGISPETEIHAFFYENWKKELDTILELVYQQYGEGKNILQPEVAERLLAVAKSKSKDIEKFLKRTAK